MNKIDWTILRKSLDQKLNDSEKESLDSWLSESENNARYYKSYREFQQKEQKEPVNSYANYLKFVNRLAEKRRRMVYSYLKYAASFIVLFSFGILLYFQMNKEIPVQVAAEIGVIKPGTEKALLYLEDGKVVNLESKKSQVIKTEQGHRIKQEGNLVSYDKLKASREEHLSYNTLKIPRGGEYIMMLNDGTKVWINSETEIKFPVVFPNNERRVEVKGEAFFDVVKDGRPFIVSTGKMNIKVLGTEFNVRAYEDEGIIQTTLVEGKVQIDVKNNKLVLKPGEQAVYAESNPNELSKRRVEVSKYVSWKDGRFIFEDERLEDIMRQIERWYDVDVFYMNEDLKDIKFRGNINRYKDFNILLEKIERLNVVEFKIKGNTITVLNK